MHTKPDIHSHTFKEPFVIDSGNCYYPSVVQTDIELGGDMPVVAWIKEDYDSFPVMKRRQDELE